MGVAEQHAVAGRRDVADCRGGGIDGVDDEARVHQRLRPIEVHDRQHPHRVAGELEAGDGVVEAAGRLGDAPDPPVQHTEVGGAERARRVVAGLLAQPLGLEQIGLGGLEVRLLQQHEGAVLDQPDAVVDGAIGAEQQLPPRRASRAPHPAGRHGAARTARWIASRPRSMSDIGPVSSSSAFSASLT